MQSGCSVWKAALRMFAESVPSFSGNDIHGNKYAHGDKYRRCKYKVHGFRLYPASEEIEVAVHAVAYCFHHFPREAQVSHFLKYAAHGVVSQK